MQLFVAALVASLGIASYAVAALVWDRRHQVPHILAALVRRRVVEVEDGAEPELSRWLAPPMIVGYALLLGTLLTFGSCIGLAVL